MTYKHGLYGQMEDSVAQSAVQSATVAAYIGTAPVHLVSGYEELDVIHQPVKITGFADAQKKLGYTKDWERFTLCEAMAAHFDNPLGNIGPVYLINVLDPTIHRGETKTSSLTFVNGRVEIPSDSIILDSITLAEKIKDVDYTVSYNFSKGTVVIQALTDITEPVDYSYCEVDTAAIQPEDIVGGVSAEGEYSGIEALSLLYPQHGVVGNLVAAPGWAHHPAVYNALCSKARKTNSKWGGYACVDIPVSEADTIEKAIAWKKEHGYGNEFSRVSWPKGMDNEGRVFHLSTLSIVEYMRVDAVNSGIPMATCSNKTVNITRLYVGENSKSRGLDEESGNELTQNGIGTAIARDGKWVLWGGHTAAYTYGQEVDPRSIFDSSIRMLQHILNSFQREWGNEIDSPMTRALKDTILNREAEKLDYLKAKGALIGNPSIQFITENNTTADLMNGDFRWDALITPTPQFKSGSLHAAYTDEGFSVYAGEGV